MNTILEILIDASGSMGYTQDSKGHEGKYLIDGQTRMSIVKRVLINDIIPTISYCSAIYIRTFRTEVEQVGENLIIKGIQTPLIYQGEFEKIRISQAINSLDDPLMGGTPIAEAINAAVVNLEKYPNNDRKIILLTDGEENGEGNYLEAAKRAASLIGNPCKIFIIGFALNDAAEVKAKEIANGGYVNLISSAFSTTEIITALTPIKVKVLEDSIENINSAPSSAQTPAELNLQPSNTPRSHFIDTLQHRIESVKKDGDRANTSTQLQSLENRIKDQISSGEKLLSEISELKDLLRMEILLQTGIDSTTLTIDSEYSEAIRQKSESFLYKYLCDIHSASKVRWLNKFGESFSHHDFELLDENNNTILFIECKGTSGDKPTFYLTAEEWAHFLTHKEMYQVYRVFKVEGDMQLFCINNLLTSILNGKVVPYLLKPEILKDGRVFLTLVN